MLNLFQHLRDPEINSGWQEEVNTETSLGWREEMRSQNKFEMISTYYHRFKINLLRINKKLYYFILVFKV